eukprot:5737652-Prymnesium_polylepis.1
MNGHECRHHVALVKCAAHRNDVCGACTQSTQLSTRGHTQPAHLTRWRSLALVTRKRFAWGGLTHRPPNLVPHTAHSAD